MNGYFANSDIIQLDRKGITMADLKHIINQRTQRAVYTMGTQSAVGAFMSQNDSGSVLILADGTGNQPGDVCTIISRTPEVAPERWAQHQYESVVETQEQVTVNGSLIARSASHEFSRTPVEFMSPPVELSPSLVSVPMNATTTVVLPDDGQASIIIHDATTEAPIMMLANEGLGAGWYINEGFIPNTTFSSITNGVFNPALLGLREQKWAFTHQTPSYFFYPIFISAYIETPVITPVGVTAQFVETPTPNRQLGIHLNHEVNGELTDAWDLQITLGNYRYRMEKVGGAGNNFIVWDSMVKTTAPDGGVVWLHDAEPKQEITVTPDNIVRILAVTSPEGYFGISYNRLAQYLVYLTGDADQTLSVPVHIASYGVESQIQPAWVDYHTFVPTSYMWQEVPTYRLPFVDGVPQYDRTSGEFYAAYNDANSNNEETSQQIIAPTTLGTKMVLWTPSANQLLIEHCRDLLIETKLEIMAARGNELSTIAGLLTQILAKP